MFVKEVESAFIRCDGCKITLSHMIVLSPKQILEISARTMALSPIIILKWLIWFGDLIMDFLESAMPFFKTMKSFWSMELP
jgi:hypothetical protein